MNTRCLSVAVVGANGFVGSQVCNELEKNNCYKLIRVVREDNLVELIPESDVVIHAANPARRFMAEANPENDFEETAVKTAELLAYAQNKSFVLISSLSCRTQMHTNYGRNRRFCELLVLARGGTVVRLGPMFGGNRKHDILHDLLMNREIYVAPETRYAYVNVSWAGERIVKLITSPPGIYEIGARDAISLADLRDYFKSKSIFSGVDDTQIPESEKDGPEAKLIFDYARQELENIKHIK